MEINPGLLNIGQNVPGKRWFRNADLQCDLFIWLNRDGSIVQLQICQDTEILEWKNVSGFRSGTLNEKQGGFQNLSTPIFAYHPKTEPDMVRHFRTLLESSKSTDELLFHSVKEIFDTV